MGAFPVGGKIHGATVTEILETRVYLDNEGKAEYIDLFEAPAPPPQAVAAAVAPDKNDQLAARNRAWFEGREVLALNLVSSPGAGKTSLLERTIRDLKGEIFDQAGNTLFQSRFTGLWTLPDLPGLDLSPLQAGGKFGLTDR